jgi:hypothetical protein
MGQRWLDGYSADIEIYLIVDGKKHDVAQIGGGSLILRDPIATPADTSAKLVIRIDGHEEIEQVVLTNGSAKDEPVISFF